MGDDKTRPTVPPLTVRLQKYLQDTEQLHGAVAIVPLELYKEAETTIYERAERINQIVGPGEDFVFQGTILLTQKMALDWLAKYNELRKILEKIGPIVGKLSRAAP